MAVAEGLFVIDKPQGLSSHEAVVRVRRRLGIRRIGHGGTLDPMATGVLVLMIGRATKLASWVQSHPKTYEADVELGRQTDTGDAWGQVVDTAPVPPLSPEAVDEALAASTGRVAQRPPAFSAVKVQGRPLYWWARKGVAVESRERMIEVHRFDATRIEGSRITCRVECSSGTYVRALAEQVAARLGTVGHLSRLVRLAVGPWTLESAWSMDRVLRASDEDLLAAILPVESVR